MKDGYIRNSDRKRWDKHKSLFIPEELRLGPTYSYLFLHRPKQLFFTYARYKFASRLIGESPKIRILELGCNEGIGSLLFAENGHIVTAVDFDEEAIAWANSNLTKRKNIIYKYDDFIGKVYGKYYAVVLLDVIEHIGRRQEGKLFKTIVDNLHTDGYCIIGTPNVTASKYSSDESKACHVNLFSAERLRDTMRKYFKNVFLFGMNDEIVHTGFYNMCHYIIALGCGKK